MPLAGAPPPADQTRRRWPAPSAPMRAVLAVRALRGRAAVRGTRQRISWREARGEHDWAPRGESTETTTRATRYLERLTQAPLQPLATTTWRSAAPAIAYPLSAKLMCRPWETTERKVPVKQRPSDVGGAASKSPKSSPGTWCRSYAVRRRCPARRCDARSAAGSPTARFATPAAGTSMSPRTSFATPSRRG